MNIKAHGIGIVGPRYLKSMGIFSRHRVTTVQYGRNLVLVRRIDIPYYPNRFTVYFALNGGKAGMDDFPHDKIKKVLSAQKETNFMERWFIKG